MEEEVASVARESGVQKVVVSPTFVLRPKIEVEYPNNVKKTWIATTVHVDNNATASFIWSQIIKKLASKLMPIELKVADICLLSLKLEEMRLQVSCSVKTTEAPSLMKVWERDLLNKAKEFGILMQIHPDKQQLRQAATGQMQLFRMPKNKFDACENLVSAVFRRMQYKCSPGNKHLLTEVCSCLHVFVGHDKSHKQICVSWIAESTNMIDADAYSQMFQSCFRSSFTMQPVEMKQKPLGNSTHVKHPIFWDHFVILHDASLPDLQPLAPREALAKLRASYTNFVQNMLIIEVHCTFLFSIQKVYGSKLVLFWSFEPQAALSNVNKLLLEEAEFGVRTDFNDTCKSETSVMERNECITCSNLVPFQEVAVRCGECTRANHVCLECDYRFIFTQQTAVPIELVCTKPPQESKQNVNLDTPQFYCATCNMVTGICCKDLHSCYCDSERCSLFAWQCLKQLNKSCH